MLIEFPINLLPFQHELLVDEHRYILMSGGVGSSKTVTGVLKTLYLAFSRPGSKSLVASSTFRMVKNNIFPLIFSFLDSTIGKKKYTYIKSDWLISLWNGSEILFGSMDQEEKMRGLTTHHVFIDEATVGMTEDVFRQLKARVRGIGYPGQMFLATNPSSPAHFLYKYFFESDNPNRRVRTINTLENFKLPKDYINDLLSETSDWRARFVEGKWISNEHGIYKDFREDIHVKNITPDVLARLEIVLGIDPGLNTYCALVMGYDKETKNIYVIDEYYVKGQDAVSNAKSIKKWLKSRFKLSGIVGDPAPSSNSLIVGQELGRKIITANKAVGAGISAVQYYFRHNQLYISPLCTNTIREIPGYAWKLSKEGEVLDEPVKKHDHALDVIRYIIYTLWKPENKHAAQAITTRKVQV